MEPEEEKVNIRKSLLSQIHHMELLWKEKLYADVTFIVQKEEIPAHRIILLKSFYFQDILQQDTIAHDKTAKVEISDISPPSFKAILEYIYFGKVIFTQSLALDLVIQADKYFLPNLKEDCESYLSAQLNITNFLDFIKAAKVAESGNLENQLVGFLIKNLEKINQEVDLHLIPQDLFVKAMRKMKLIQFFNKNIS